mmetsp:Transcript_2021/g.7213  ORF Transcript_2021/g.7213 Transcript_2021/m.7213 type:complete len:210 (+) Transcript_2021:106-735(+)
MRSSIRSRVPRASRAPLRAAAANDVLLLLLLLLLCGTYSRVYERAQQIVDLFARVLNLVRGALRFLRATSNLLEYPFGLVSSFAQVVDQRSRRFAEFVYHRRHERRRWNAESILTKTLFFSRVGVVSKTPPFRRLIRLRVVVVAVRFVLLNRRLIRRRRVRSSGGIGGINGSVLVVIVLHHLSLVMSSIQRFFVFLFFVVLFPVKVVVL